MEMITDKQVDDFYRSNNPYENYGEKVIIECENCSTELINDDEVYIRHGFVYCSYECMLNGVEYEKQLLIDFMERG